jgi:ParB family transcriptional regulator, chromosome partitioning protein
MNRVVSVSPFRCRMWSDHDRMEEYLTEATCREEIESFRKQGQLLPALGRSLHDNPDYDVELIFGARRLFVAQHLNVPLQIELRDLSDKQAIMALYTENRCRQDVSPYERGLSYYRWIQSGYFKSQDELARELGISPAQVSRLLKLVKLPAVIVNAFKTPLEICEGWGVELCDLCLDATLRQTIVARARAIARKSPRPGAVEVYETLRLGIGRARRREGRYCDEVVRDSSGSPLFRIKYQRDSVALLFASEKLSARSLRGMKGLIKEFFQSGSAQAQPPVEIYRDDTTATNELDSGYRTSAAELHGSGPQTG